MYLQESVPHCAQVHIGLLLDSATLYCNSATESLHSNFPKTALRVRGRIQSTFRAGSPETSYTNHCRLNILSSLNTNLCHQEEDFVWQSAKPHHLAMFGSWFDSMRHFFCAKHLCTSILPVFGVFMLFM